MKVYCIRRHFRAMDDWYVDENYLFTDKSLCTERLQTLQRKYKDDYERECSVFVEYSINEKELIFVEDNAMLQAINH